MINLVVKGNIFDASNAAHQRGVTLITMAQQFRSDKPAEVIASAPDTALDAVRMWYCEEPGQAPFPAGVLLFYSQLAHRAPELAEYRRRSLEEREAAADAAFKAEFGD